DLRRPSEFTINATRFFDNRHPYRKKEAASRHVYVSVASSANFHGVRMKWSQESLRRIGMKTVMSVASALACAVSLNAQITATLNRLPGDATEIRIRNNSTVSLAAFVLALHYVHG